MYFNTPFYLTNPRYRALVDAFNALLDRDLASARRSGMSLDDFHGRGRELRDALTRMEAGTS